MKPGSVTSMTASVSRTMKERRLKAPLPPPFNLDTFFSTVRQGTTILSSPQKQTLFSQGDTSEAIFFIQAGKVKLTVVSEHGKEAVVAMLEQGAFVGESCLVDQAIRPATATTLEDARILRIDKAAMLRLLQEQPKFADAFTSYLLLHSIRIQEDLVDQLFNSSEKRLARALLLLAHFGKESKPQTVIGKISQETLAEMIGTTRSRVSFFMNKFRKLGFIDYKGGSHRKGTLHVHSSLLTVVLHD